jgi:hypothetical protein
MDIEPAMTQGRAGWSRILISAVLVFAPIALAVILVFGGGQVNQCLGGRCATLPPPEQVPVIGSQAGLIAIVLAVSAFWLVAAALAIRSLWLTDRARLGRATAVSAGLVVATAVVTVVVRLIDGQRLRVVAEDAGLYAIGAAIIAIPLALAWAVLTSRVGDATDTGRAGGSSPSSG